MNNIIKNFYSVLSDMNYANRRLFEIQTGQEHRPRRRRSH